MYIYPVFEEGTTKMLGWITAKGIINDVVYQLYHAKDLEGANYNEHMNAIVDMRIQVITLKVFHSIIQHGEHTTFRPAGLMCAKEDVDKLPDTLMFVPFSEEDLRRGP